MTDGIRTSRWVDVAHDLAPLVAAEAQAASAQGRMTDTVMDAFRDAELFWMMVPESLSGGGADSVAMIEVVEELSRADASAGWSLMATIGATGFASAFLPDAGAERILGGGRRGVAAGQLAPRGAAVHDGDGIIVNGRYSFGSGIAAADWVAGGAMVMDGDERAMVDGRPDVRVVYLPKDQVELKGNWDVLGLEGTGSVDYEIVEQHVPSELTFPLIKPRPRPGATSYRLTLYGLGSVGHGAVALGIGKRALEEIAGIAKHKQRQGQEGIGSQQVFLNDFGRQDAALQAARSFLIDAYASAEAYVVSADQVTTLQYQRMRQAVTHATIVAADVVRFAYTWGGSNSLRRPSALGDCLRHISAATQHMFVDPSSMVDAARLVLDSITERQGSVG